MCNMPYMNFPYFFDPMCYYYHCYIRQNEDALRREQMKNETIKQQKVRQKYSKNKNKDAEWTIQNQQKQIKFQNFNQKEGRNIISNILRSFLKYLTSKQAKDAFERLCQQHQVNYTLKDILNWLQLRQINYRNYVRLDSIINIIKIDKQGKGKILAMLFIHYSKKYLRNHFLTSQRLNQNNKNNTISKIREVDQKILQIYE